MQVRVPNIAPSYETTEHRTTSGAVTFLKHIETQQLTCIPVEFDIIAEVIVPRSLRNVPAAVTGSPEVVAPLN
jgi:hypothetical protein